MKKVILAAALAAASLIGTTGAMATPMPTVQHSTGHYQLNGSGAVGIYTNDGAWFNISLSLSDGNDLSNAVELFGYDATPGDYSLVSVNDHSFLGNDFVFRFDIDTNRDGVTEYSLFSDATLNQYANGTSVDYGVQHVYTNSISANILNLNLEDILSINSPDWDINDWGGTLITTCGTISEVNAPVPEPATMMLFGVGLVGLAGTRFRKGKKIIKA